MLSRDFLTVTKTHAMLAACQSTHTPTQNDAHFAAVWKVRGRRARNRTHEARTRPQNVPVNKLPPPSPSHPSHRLALRACQPKADKLRVKTEHERKTTEAGAARATAVHDGTVALSVQHGLSIPAHARTQSGEECESYQ